MSRIFVASDGFPKSISRKNACGYKGLTIVDDVTSLSCIDIKSDANGTGLEVVPAEEDGQDEIYTILCKEFGLVGYNEKFESKVSVVFLDDGYMLVTLLKGAIIINLNEKLMMPAVGVDSVPKVSNDEILWVSPERIMQYKKYWGTKGKFLYDFEFVFELKGAKINDNESFMIRAVSNEDADISLGHVAVFEQQQQFKEDAKEAKKLRNSFFNSAHTEMDFDDDDEDFEDEEDDDDYSEDWD